MSGLVNQYKKFIVKETVLKVVLCGQTTFLAQGVITCSISTQPKKAWSIAYTLLVLLPLK